jgi:hypothetical protein
MIARQRMKLEKTRDLAVSAAPRAAREAVDKTFSNNARTLGGAADGFDAKPTAVAPAADRQGQAQVRQNQADAVQATE